MSPGSPRRGPKRHEVAIFGGGIAGLTAAHELIERGCGVEVYEKAQPGGIEEIRGAPGARGGMARTQWGRIDRPRRRTKVEPWMGRVDVLTADRMNIRGQLGLARIDFGAPLPNDDKAL